MKVEATERGFALIEFFDQFGVECSLQISSLTEACVWLGVDEPDVKFLVPGKGWQEVPIPKGALRSGRMHLTQDMVRELLPHLQQFVETGQLREG